MPTLRALALIFASLLLAACGDAPGGSFGPDAGTSGVGQVNDAFASALDVEIDEAVLADLLDAHGRVLAAGDALVPLPNAKVPGSSWTLAHYGRLWIKWKVMKEAARGGAESAERNLKQYETQLEQLRAKAASASASEREVLAQRIAFQENTLATQTKHAETLRTLSTPEVKALVQAWAPRFEELEAKYDE
ncbi:MAG: hypothetical protein QNJ90_04585 [Planctomycetota bacterium]|nr:hypothetical protein [Planctomycetota bacterium]